MPFPLASMYAPPQTTQPVMPMNAGQQPNMNTTMPIGQMPPSGMAWSGQQPLPGAMPPQAPMMPSQGMPQGPQPGGMPAPPGGQMSPIAAALMAHSAGAPQSPNAANAMMAQRIGLLGK